MLALGNEQKRLYARQIRDAFSAPDIIVALRRRTVMRRFEIGKDHKSPLDREKTQKNVDLHFAVESQIHSSSVAPQE